MADDAATDAKIQGALDGVEALETRLAALLADPRLARRLRRGVRQESSGPARDRALADGWPRPGLRPPSPREAAHYADLVSDLAAVPFPRDAAELAFLHGRLTGDGRVPFRLVPAQLRGTQKTVLAPEPDAVPEAVERVLHWANTVPAHPAVVGALLAGEMLAIRPFKRGDPLLSRLLMRIVLQSNGLGAAGDLVVDRKVDLTEPGNVDVLIDAIAQREPERWVLRVLGHLAEGLEEASEDARFAQGYLDTLNERQWRLADWFRRSGRTTTGQEWRFRDIHAVFSHVPPRTLKRDLATLREAGILEMDGKLKSARYRYVAEMTAKGTAVPGMS